MTQGHIEHNNKTQFMDDSFESLRPFYEFEIRCSWEATFYAHKKVKESCSSCLWFPRMIGTHTHVFALFSSAHSVTQVVIGRRENRTFPLCRGVLALPRWASGKEWCQSSTRYTRNPDYAANIAGRRYNADDKFWLCDECPAIWLLMLTIVHTALWSI